TSAAEGEFPTTRRQCRIYRIRHQRSKELRNRGLDELASPARRNRVGRHRRRAGDHVEQGPRRLVVAVFLLHHVVRRLLGEVRLELADQRAQHVIALRDRWYRRLRVDREAAARETTLM